MNRIKNHMQYTKFWQLGVTDWYSNGRLAIKKEILFKIPIRYSKYAYIDRLYKPKDIDMDKAVARFYDCLSALPKKVIEESAGTLYKLPECEIDTVIIAPGHKIPIVQYLWRVWYDSNTSYIFDADKIGFILHRLKDAKKVLWHLVIKKFYSKYEKGKVVGTLPILLLYTDTYVACLTAIYEKN